MISTRTKSLDEWLDKKEESEGKSIMVHNVNVKYEENRVLEEFWVISGTHRVETGVFVTDKEFVSKDLDHEPSMQEIAQFLYEEKADFAHVKKKYRLK